MEGITISQAAGGQRAYFPDALQKDDELQFLRIGEKHNKKWTALSKRRLLFLQCGLGTPSTM